MKKSILQINTTFSKRLKKRCGELGYTTESMLLDAIQAKNPDVKSSTVHSWWSYVSIPGNDNMTMLADILDCDIDYLLGRMDETTHTRKYIREETGLSEGAITALQNSPETTYGGLMKLQGKQLGATVSHLLTSEHGLRILQYLGDYLSSDTLQVTYKGEQITEDILVSNSGTQKVYSISPREYDAVILTQIQQEITLLKHTKDK